MRLQKYMANAGVASRRKSEEMILQGEVKVNGKTVKELGYKVNIEKDKVSVNGINIKLVKNFTYVLLNKPIGVVSSAKDEKDRMTVVDLVDVSNKRLYPVGRLDIDTTGLVLLTDDGEFANHYMHPRNKVEKKYIATVQGLPNKESLEKLRKGLYVDGKKTLPAKVRVLKNYIEDSIIEISIFEGRNRQIKKMFEAVKHPVKKLKRIEIGDLNLGDLKPGEWRYLTENEVKSLKNSR